MHFKPDSEKARVSGLKRCLKKTCCNKRNYEQKKLCLRHLLFPSREVWIIGDQLLKIDQCIQLNGTERWEVTLRQNAPVSTISFRIMATISWTILIEGD